MAANLVLLLLSASIAAASGNVVYLTNEKKLLYSGSVQLNLTDTQKLCRSLGGELPTLKHYSEDLLKLQKITYETVWLGVSKIAKPVHPKDPTKPYRRYTWQDGTAFSDFILDSIPKVSCDKVCCSLKVVANSAGRQFQEEFCNSTALPVCVISLTLANMAKLLKAADSFTNEMDKSGLATHVLPEFTSQMYDRMEGYRNTTHPVLFALLAVVLSVLLVLVVMGIIMMRGKYPGFGKKKRQQRQQLSQQQVYQPPSQQQEQRHQRRNGSRSDGKEEEGIFLPEIGDIPNERVISTDI